MTTSRPAETSSSSDLFPIVRRGYQREVVDRYARRIQADLDQLKQRCDVLKTENTELRAAREETVTMSGPADFTGLGHRAQEILRMAEEQARDVTRRAARDADQLPEETQAELDRRRETVNAELDELRQSQLRELESLRRQAERDAEEVCDAHPDRDRAAARRRPDGGRGREERVRGDRPGSLVQTATLEAEAMRAAAEKDAGRISQQAAEKRSRTLAELEKAQKEAQRTAADCWPRPPSSSTRPAST